MGTSNLFKGKILRQTSGNAALYPSWICDLYSPQLLIQQYKNNICGEIPLKKCLKDRTNAIAIFKRELLANVDELRKVGILFGTTVEPMDPDRTLELTLEAVKIALSNGVPVQIRTNLIDWAYSEKWETLCATKKLDFKKIAIGLVKHLGAESWTRTYYVRIAMEKCREMGCRIFAEIDVNDDLMENFEQIMHNLFPYCDYFVVGLLCGCKKSNKKSLAAIVYKWNNILDKVCKKIHWKKCIVDSLGNDFIFCAGSCVDADYNIFVQHST